MRAIVKGVAFLVFLGLTLANQFAVAKVSATIESWDVQYVVTSKSDMSIIESKRIRINDSDGYRNAVFYTYYDKYRKLRGLTMVVYDAFGKKVKRLAKGDAVDVLLNSSYEIDDARLVVLDPKYQNYPFTVEIEADYSLNGFLDFDTWNPRDRYDVEVKNATLKLTCPTGYEFRTLEENGVSKPAITEEGASKILTWSIKDLQAVSSYENDKLFKLSQPAVWISPVEFAYGNTEGSLRTWGDFGDWYMKINTGRNGLSDQTKQDLDRIREKNKGDVMAVVRDVYKYMQVRTRYISIQLGIGGFQSIPSDVVDKTGYGDCKALTNYTMAMLEYLKIPSNYVLVYAGTDEPDVKDIPMNQFNHVFLGVPAAKDTLWLECTSQISPPFYLGTFTDDRNVLWVQSKSSKLIRTPKLQSHQSVMFRKAIVKVNQSGDAVTTLKIEKTGLFFDDAFAYQHYKKDELDSYNLTQYYYKDFSITNWNYKIPDPIVPLLTEDVELKITRLGQVVQEKVIIPFNPLTPVEKNFAMDNINKVVEVGRAFTVEDFIEVIAPENFHSDFLPNELKEKNEFGQIEMSIKTNDANNLVIYKKATFEKGFYKGETYDRFNAFLKKIRQAEQSKIVYKGKT
jgi:hypothetical protein